MPSRRSVLVLTALLLPLGLTTACAQQSDPSPEELQEDLADELLQRDAALTAEQADCYAGLLVAELGVEDVVDVDLSEEAPEGPMAEGIAAAATEARTECGLTDPPG